MKFRDEPPFASVDAAVRKLLDIANELEADHAGRLSVGILNAQFKDAGGSYPEYSAATIDRGYITMHASGGYLSFTRPARICLPERRHHYMPCLSNTILHAALSFVRFCCKHC